MSVLVCVCVFRRGRETGVCVEQELEKEEAVFEYVDDKEYARIVHKRQQEAFVLDDGEAQREEKERREKREKIDNVSSKFQ